MTGDRIGVLEVGGRIWDTGSGWQGLGDRIMGAGYLGGRVGVLDLGSGSGLLSLGGKVWQSCFFVIHGRF